MNNITKFRGEDNVYEGLKNFNEFSSLKKIGKLNQVLALDSPINICYHVGRTNFDLDKCLSEILLIKLENVVGTGSIDIVSDSICDAANIV